MRQTWEEQAANIDAILDWIERERRSAMSRREKCTVRGCCRRRARGIELCVRHAIKLVGRVLAEGRRGCR